MDKELIKYGLVCLLTILLNVANLVALCTSQNPFTWVIIIVVYFLLLAIIHIEDIYNKIGEHYVEKNYGHNKY